MPRESKSYLDLFLDNLIKPKKRGIYFTDEHEQAIIKFNDSSTDDKEKAYLFENFIEPSFRRIITGVLEMPKFHHLGGLNREELVDNTFYRLVEKINRFKPGMIGKKNQPVKAYSYFSTITKNHILEQKLRNEKVLKHKADVESSIDLSILSEETLQKMSDYDKQDVSFETYESIFEETKLKILSEIDKIIKTEEEKDKKDLDLIKLGYCLKYLIKKWDKIEFMKKNEFMRILALYVGLKQQQVSVLFKKFKIAILENINPSLINKKKYTKKVKIKKIDIEEEEINFEDEDFEIEKEIEEQGFKYEINSMEDFEIESEKNSNIEIKNKWKKIKNQQ